MENNDLNEKLTSLYEKHWDDFIEHVYKNGEKPCAFPYLIATDERYAKARKRVMICGQETNGWGKEKDYSQSSGILELQEMYYNFVKGNYSYSFWRFIRELRMRFSEDVGFIYQNIVKVGKYQAKGADDTIYQLSKNHFPVWQEELQILKPDIIVFLTGPNYDGKIRYALGNVNPTQLTKNNKIVELHFEKHPNLHAIKTYHPGYLSRVKSFDEMLERIHQYIESM